MSAPADRIVAAAPNVPYRFLGWLVAGPVLLVAAALRIYRLDGQSLWSDEGASVIMAGRNIVEIVQHAAGDIHPPLYYILLHWWALGVGQTAFALRYLSVLLGIVVVALVYQLGYRLAGRSIALMAATVAAVSPLLVYYSQELRMYMLMAALATAATICLLRLLEPRPASRWWLTYFVTAMAALYTQYFAATVLIFHNIVFLIAVVARGTPFLRPHPPRPREGELESPSPLTGRGVGGEGSPSPAAGGGIRVGTAWLLCQIAIGAAYLPWYWLVEAQLASWPAVSEPFSLATLIRRVIQVFGFGVAAAEVSAPPLELALAGLALLGAGGLAVRRRWPAAFLLGYLAIPVLLMYAISLSRPIYNPKFLLVALPPFCVLLALGVRTVWTMTSQVIGGHVLRMSRLSDDEDRQNAGTREPRHYTERRANDVPGPDSSLCRSPTESGTPGKIPSRQLIAFATGALVVAVLLGPFGLATARALQAYYVDPQYARDDYRGLAQTVATLARPGDGVLLNAPGQVEIFDYYFRGDLPRYPLPRQRPLDPVDAAAALTDIADRHDRLWLVRWGAEQADPGGFIDRWLNSHAFKTSNRWFGGIQLILYTLPRAQADGLRPAQARFGEQIQLAGFSLGGGGELATVAAGDALPLTLRWMATGDPESRYTVFTHLIDETALIWGQRDSEPAGGTRPTDGWTAGDLIDDRYGLAVFPGTPPGRYVVAIGLYRADTGERLPVEAPGEPIADRLILGTIQVERPAAPPDPAALDVQHRVNRPGRSLDLIGYNLHRLGAGLDAAQFRHGDLALLTLFWRAPAHSGLETIVHLCILATDGRTTRERSYRLGGDRAPVEGWQPGDIIRDQQIILLDLPPGSYRVAVDAAPLGLAPPDRAPIGPLTVGE